MPQGGVLEHNRSRTSRPIDDGIDVVIADGPVLTFVPHAGRISSCLVMPVIGRRVDVSVSRRTAVLTITQAAERNDMPLTQAEAITRRALEAVVETAGAWAPRHAGPDDSLVARIGGAAFPLLGAAYEQGVEAIDEVPRWAAPILCARTARDGAKTAFGVKATRPVVTALAHSLTRVDDNPVDLSRLAFALIAAGVVGPDRIVRVLTFDGQSWPLQRLPEPHLLEDGRRAAERWGAEHTMRYLEEACSQDDGLTVFVDCIRYATDLGAHAPGRLPTHLTELHDLYRSRFSLPPAPQATRRRRTPRQQADAQTSRSTNERFDALDAHLRSHLEPTHPREGYGLRVAPQVPDTVQVSPQDRIPHPAWLRAVDGVSFGEFRIVLPGCCGDLTNWARVLRSCLGTYDRAVMAGQSHLIGIDQNNRLRYVVEVTPTHRVRQFAGHANRMPSEAHHDTIVEFLTRTQILR